MMTSVIIYIIIIIIIIIVMNMLYAIVPFETSNSTKPYPSVFHAHAGKSRPAIGLFEPNDPDEASSRVPPTSQRG